MGQRGATHLVLLLVMLGLVGFLLVSSSAEFKNQVFSRVFHKDQSYAISQPVPSPKNHKGDKDEVEDEDASDSADEDEDKDKDEDEDKDKRGGRDSDNDNDNDDRVTSPRPSSKPGFFNQ